MADKSYVYVLGRLDAMNRTVHRHSSMAGLWQDADRLQVPSCEELCQSHPVQWNRA